MKRRTPTHSTAMNQGSSDTAHSTETGTQSNPPATVNGPAMPNPQTRQHRLLSLLKGGKSITQPEWSLMGFGWRLAADVQALEYKGWNILSDRIDYKGRQIARYRLGATAKTTKGA